MKRFLVVLMALAAVACGAPESGEVVDKRFTPEKEWNERVCAKKQKVKSGTRTNTTCAKWKTVKREKDEVYEFLLNDGEDEGWRAVSEDDYNEYDKGEQYP